MSATRTAGSDGTIIVWQSPGTSVDNDTVLTRGNILHAVEFRFPETTGGEAKNILSDADINLRDGATAAEAGELLTAPPAFFASAATGDLHLLASDTSAIGQGVTVPSVTDDIDGDPRSAAYDIGADQYNASPTADGGRADGGNIGSDAGPRPGDAGSPADAGSPGGVSRGGCGCSDAGGSGALLAPCALLAAAFRRRRLTTRR